MNDNDIFRAIIQKIISGDIKNDKDFFIVHCQVSGVLKGFKHRIKVGYVVFFAGVCLFNKNAVRAAVPNTAPGFVGPAQAKWEVGFS